jgi:predicted RNA-binding protein with PIN domain
LSAAKSDTLAVIFDMPFIIDGYNLLHSIQKHTESAEAINEVQLCHMIGRYLRIIGDKAEIVFDGVGPPEKMPLENVYNTEAIFVGTGTDADTIIENKIYANSAPKRLIIVSSDRRIRRAAKTRKAASVKSEKFWTDLQKKLDRKRTVKEPAQKRNGLSESETKQWLKFFDLEQ